MSTHGDTWLEAMGLTAGGPVFVKTIGAGGTYEGTLGALIFNGEVMAAVVVEHCGEGRLVTIPWHAVQAIGKGGS